jgi:CubicO group peptidase (beta-lactamase class C family)
LAVGVIKDQELIYAKGFGVMNLETGGEVTPRTLFHMAPVIKPFVARSIVQLLEQKELSLGDRIVEYLPYFEVRVHFFNWMPSEGNNRSHALLT